MAHAKALLDDVCVALNREGVAAERNIPLAAYTTFRIGGVADILATATAEAQIAAAVCVAASTIRPLSVMTTALCMPIPFHIVPIKSSL